MELCLKGKNALVTGGGAGLGLACALAFAPPSHCALFYVRAM